MPIRLSAKCIEGHFGLSDINTDVTNFVAKKWHGNT